MIRKSFIMKLFDGFSIRRWSDLMQPVPLVEIDKHAHKMVIAYCLGRFEELAGQQVNWHDIIRGGIYELLRRVVISDIKSPVYRTLRELDPAAFQQLSDWVYRELEHIVPSEAVKTELKQYLSEDGSLDGRSRMILEAAHLYASYWEFQLLKLVNPADNYTARITEAMNSDIEQHLDLVGMRKLLTKMPPAEFVDLMGRLRHQVRWGQTARIPPTSVLGHTMMVACTVYFMSREVDACDIRIRNNFLGGLFHDLPEAVTRDIISPVKRAVPEMEQVIAKIERQMMAEQVHRLLPMGWVEEVRYFTEDEFTSKIRENDTIRHVTSDEINSRYNGDACFPIDGELIKAADDLAAYVEAYRSEELGIRSNHLTQAMHNLSAKWGSYPKSV
jgi:putative hydrolase of HD superfamily